MNLVLEEDDGEIMCFQDYSTSIKDRKATAQPIIKSKSGMSNEGQHEIDLSAEKKRRSTLNKEEAEE